MRIACPLCGERGHEEFSYLGDAAPLRPSLEALSADWVDYVYFRDNPPGAHREFWYHGSGCQAWLVVTRDISSHQILAVDRAAGPA
jgi:sarcosine oxidase subunit delta